MKNLKDLLTTIEDEESTEDEVEVYADSVRQALELAADELNLDISELDYEIIEKGTKGLLGMGRQPYKVLIKPARIQYDEDDISEIEQKLGKISEGDLELRDADKYRHGKFSIRVTKTGVWLKVTPPKGDGKRVDTNDVTTSLYSMRLNSVDMTKVEKEVKKASGKPVKIGEWVPNPEFDGAMSVEVTEDEMKAVVHFSPPRFSGRHMDLDDVLESLKSNGVVTGIKEEVIAEYLENMDYSQPLIAAEGVRPRHGRDAYIDYKASSFFPSPISWPICFDKVLLSERI